MGHIQILWVFQQIIFMKILKKNFRKLIYYICKNHSYKTFSMKNIIKIFIVLILVQSCTPMKKITYLNNSESGKWNISPIPPKHQLEIGEF